MKYPWGPIKDLTRTAFFEVVHGCETVTDVLRNLGYSPNGQNRRTLGARAAMLGVDLPGKQFTARTSTQMTGPLPPGQLAPFDFVEVPGGQSVLPPGERTPCMDDLGEPLSGTAWNSLAAKQQTVYDEGAEVDTRAFEPQPPLRDDMPRMCELRAFQSTIDQLESEISELLVEVDKRKRAQDALRVLGE